MIGSSRAWRVILFTQPETDWGTTMCRKILVLEDDLDRLRRFRALLAEYHPEFSIVVWPDAHVMIRELDQHIDSAALICLDHDLYPADERAPDPGDGLDVAKRLAELSPCCPVLIHSSNSDRSRMMQGELDFAGWSCRRIAPIGHNWVEADWARVVRDLLIGGVAGGGC